MPVSNVSEAAEYWSNLAAASYDHKLASGVTPAANKVAKPAVASSRAARLLRQPVSWNDRYVFTSHQKQYLQRFMH